jgi:glycosyltransferase involved in cell wall biosynthesis
MDISVIIPTKDRLAYLQRVLPSYLKQPEVREIVVIIDGSSDGTLEFLEEYCQAHTDVRFFDNGVNRGIPFSRNRGIENATSDYIFMAEDDLELTERFFQTLGEHMTLMNADVICGRNIFRLDTESAAESVVRTNRFRGSYVNMKTIEIETGMDIHTDQFEPIIASPMLAKATIFREVKYDEQYRVNFWREETDFQLSVRERGYTLACCPHAICFNFQITHDRGGVYAVQGLRREKWVVINNWLFVKKHERFIAENFDIGNKRLYIARFALGRVLKYLVVLPLVHRLSKVKRFVLQKRLRKPVQ